MEDGNGQSPLLERAHALRAYAARARDRADQCAATAGQLSKRAGTARRHADLARDRAAHLHAHQLSRRTVTDFA
ncbi:hypothetical protein ACQP2F_37415 [Actinoplanes sp. CA-030573]|uniref:hypothetical protein n=1 Tax=Actinoplanes sp. CA-030573 TaxID=3239898 RepID=UPI003D8BDC9C